MARKYPTPQQKRVADNFILSGSVTQSGLAAYKINSNLPIEKQKKLAYWYGYQALNKPSVVSYIENVLNSRGLSDEYLSERLRKIIEKGTSKSALKKAQPSDALRGIEMTFRLRDRFPSERIETTTKELKIELSNKNNEQLNEELNNTINELKKLSELMNNK